MIVMSVEFRVFLGDDMGNLEIEGSNKLFSRKSLSKKELTCAPLRRASKWKGLWLSLHRHS
jgi:hypothetical protein